VAAVLPSNQFQLSEPVVGADGTITESFNTPGAGTVTGTATTGVPGKLNVTAAKKKKKKKKATTVVYGTGTVALNGPGLVTLKIPQSAAAKKALKKAKKLQVSLAVTFTPLGGTPNTKTTSVTVSGKKGKKKH
jgi:VCBS repeat-containing protein